MAPQFLFKSFLLVSGAYLANLLVQFFVAWAIFPETIEVLASEPAEFERIIEAEPERVFPESMAWVLLATSGVSCYVCGYWVVRLAPMAEAHHLIFFAAILFFQFLQLAIGADSGIQAKLILYMAACPIAALLGGGRALKRSAPQPPDPLKQM